MMTVWSVVGVAVVATMLTLTLRQTQPSFAVGLTVVVGALLLIGAFEAVLPAFREVGGMLSRYTVGGAYRDVLIKAIGISLLTQTAADVCRDAGETALCGRVEFCGKVLLVLCGLPLFEYAVTLLDGLIGAGVMSP